jgi:hypothetical protein
MPGAEDYMVEAALASAPPSGTFYDPNHATNTERLQSLGVHERWNNDKDRKYSRNLGTGNGIELMTLEGVASAIRDGKQPIAPSSALQMRIGAKSAYVSLILPAGGPVSLCIFDAAGKSIATVVNGYLAAGAYKIDWKKAAGAGLLAKGSYLLVLKSPRAKIVQKVTFTG